MLSWTQFNRYYSINYIYNVTWYRMLWYNGLIDQWMDKMWLYEVLYTIQCNGGWVEGDNKTYNKSDKMNGRVKYYIGWMDEWMVRIWYGVIQYDTIQYHGWDKIWQNDMMGWMS